MPTVRAFGGYMVNPARAEAVIAPAYDSLAPVERARYADAHPDNFLNVMRTREDYPDETIDIQQILERNQANLRRMLESGCFLHFDKPAMFIYQLSHGAHVQTGLVAELPVAEIDRGAVLRHEQTRVERERLLVQYQKQVGASSSPVALAYRANPDISALKSRLIAGREPALDTQAEDGVRQVLWKISDDQSIAELRDAFERVPVTYLTDGHHRTAAASRYVASLAEQGRLPDSDGAWNHVLVALFAHDELKILPFNRVVRDLGDLEPEQFLDKLEVLFDVELLNADPDRPALPESTGIFTMVLDRQCFRLRLRYAGEETGDPARALDVSVLERCVLNDILGIADGRSDPRLDYVSGSAGYDGVNHLRAAGWRLAIYCHPASIEDIMKVSDAGRIMPPKSTCFEPKVRSGLFLRLNEAD
jgi:uncharacterized protein (DUF1015 family)